MEGRIWQGRFIGGPHLLRFCCRNAFGCFVVPFSWGKASEPAGETMNPYCVILWPEPLVNPVSYPRTKRFFLRARSADGAIQAALADNPHWRVIGIEPRDLFAGLLQGASSCPKPHDWHAA
jgi:hypothetical protein